MSIRIPTTLIQIIDALDERDLTIRQVDAHQRTSGERGRAEHARLNIVGDL